MWPTLFFTVIPASSISCHNHKHKFWTSLLLVLSTGMPTVIVSAPFSVDSPGMIALAWTPNFIVEPLVAASVNSGSLVHSQVSGTTHTI